ncbi:uncharacterized protein CLUP02_04862 [Colletotrichum lupini]|uniref:Uncharacterized protein n=1 Tax=Colletotrichum lupini TaxID=145971 RepID=A0A9Q8SLM3_9PEZI|nr:uncharacterized protein CLUP02_04862 [Colletotrichum lupini]UQC79383.1 hypothetical protein CLUP02_04862 [Colletotrichum lupini]
MLEWKPPIWQSISALASPYADCSLQCSHLSVHCLPGQTSEARNLANGKKCKENCAALQPSLSLSPVVARAAACVHPEPPVPAVAKTGRRAMARLYDVGENARDERRSMSKLSLAPTSDTFERLCCPFSNWLVDLPGPLRTKDGTDNDPYSMMFTVVGTCCSSSFERSNLSYLLSSVSKTPRTSYESTRVTLVSDRTTTLHYHGNGRDHDMSTDDRSTVSILNPSTHTPSIPPQKRVSAAVLDRPAATGGRWGDPSKLQVLQRRSSSFLACFLTQGTEIHRLQPAYSSVPNHGHSIILPIRTDTLLDLSARRPGVDISAVPAYVSLVRSRPLHVPLLGFPNPEIPSLGSIFRDILFFSFSPSGPHLLFSKKTFTIRPSFPPLCAIAFSHFSSSAEPQKLLHSTINYPVFPLSSH